MPAEPATEHPRWQGYRVWIVVILLGVAACESPGSAAFRSVRGDEPASAPDQRAMRLLATAAEASSGCVAVVHRGEVVFERYGVDAMGTRWSADTDGETWSVTKSVTAMLVGIAQDQGSLDLDEPASTYIHEWRGTDSESVTIRQVLANTSGRHWSRTGDEWGLFRADDRSAHAIALGQQDDPGTVWRYNNAAIQALEQVLERATGDDLTDFAETNLFGPMGMEVGFELDASGAPSLYMGLRAGCLDLARLGLLTLQDGVWGDARLVSADFVAAATAPSSELNGSYGLLWWLNSTGEWEGIPTDAFAARGLGQQMLLVIPSLDIVVVRLGHADGVEDYEGELLEDLARIVVDGLTP